MYIHGQRKMISIRIRPEEGHSSGIFYINLPTTIAFRYHKYLFEKKMATVWLKEKTKLLILKEINKIAAKYGDPLIDTSEILSPSSYLAGQRRNSKKYMRKYNLAYFKERQDKFRRSVSEVIDSYHINYDWIEDNYDKIIARYYFPELLKKDESNGNK